MKYMFLLFNEPGTETPESADMKAWESFGENASKVATMVSGEALQPGDTATVVSVRDGKRMTTDGPFIETKEQLECLRGLGCDVVQGYLLARPLPPDEVDLQL